MKVCGQKILSKTFCLRFHPNKNSKTSSNNREFFVCNMTCSTFAYLTFASRYGHIWLYMMCTNNQEGVDMALKRRTRGHIGTYNWQHRLQALHMRQFQVALRLSPCCGLRPWQRFEIDLQVAFASPNFGADAKNNCCTSFRNLARHRLRYHFEVAIPLLREPWIYVKTLEHLWSTRRRATPFLLRYASKSWATEGCSDYMN